MWRPHESTLILTALARLICGMRRRSVTVADHRVMYLEGGEGQTLVLLHGIGADKDNFLLVARQLAAHYHLIVPDLPGFGESDAHHEAPYDVATQVSRLHKFLGELGLDRVHLGGNSMGGLVASAYAASYPVQVLSLWLLAPAGLSQALGSGLRNALDAGIPLPIFAKSVREMWGLLRFVIHRPIWLPRFVLKSLAERQRRAYALNQRIVASLAEGPELDHYLRSNPCVPTLIAWGREDLALDASGAELLVSILERSEIQLLDAVGHVPMIEAPRRCAADFRRFQARLRSGSLPHARNVVSDD